MLINRFESNCLFIYYCVMRDALKNLFSNQIIIEDNSLFYYWILRTIVYQLFQAIVYHLFQWKVYHLECVWISLFQCKVYQLQINRS